MVYSHSLSLPWSISAEDERRFRKILITVLALTIALGIAIPLLPVFKKPVEQEAELPPRVAKLVFEKRTEPKPKPKPKPVEKKKPEPKKEVKKTMTACLEAGSPTDEAAVHAMRYCTGEISDTLLYELLDKLRSE